MLIEAMSKETYMHKLLKSMTDEDGKPCNIQWLANKLGRTYSKVHPDVAYGFKPRVHLETIKEYAEVLNVSAGELADNHEIRQ